MQIKRVSVKNYRSFEELDIALGKFNVIVGANASGKSNFISIFSFIKNLVEFGLNDAISLVGGIEYLRNVYLLHNDKISLEIEAESLKNGLYRFSPFKEEMAISPKKIIYKLELLITENEKEYQINEEEMKIFCKFFKINIDNEEMKENFLDDGEISILRTNGKIQCKVSSKSEVIDKDLVKRLYLFDDEKISDMRLDPDESIIRGRSIPIPFISFMIERILKGIHLYEINPKPPKEFSRISGKSELEPDGKNLILILKKLLNDKKKEEKLAEIIKDFLPFIEKISIDKLADKYICANIKEIFSKDKFLPASLMSDGTINIIALIIILYFEEKPIIIIEEPEGNIHPFLISKVIDMMKDVSHRMKKQIIITTHNPEIVKYAGIEHLYLMQRNNKGFSNMVKPEENKQVQIFLENQMSIDELFIQNFLG
ncbi:MAG: AAA family ATPase [Candidatus Lokiarchaeota archaeon]|nr:AAA family ATPase [Candidatus Lokiarchaeota archaeon]MBD3200663.1 AAA family ATPase [Candidatus Lokiarchaeota archaeon]